MMKLLSTDGFYNFKCGEIYCVTPTNYNVGCCLCGQKLLFHEFLQHFKKLHLPRKDVDKKSTTVVLDKRATKTTPQSSPISGVDIKSESDQDDAESVSDFSTVDLENGSAKTTPQSSLIMEIDIKAESVQDHAESINYELKKNSNADKDEHIEFVEVRLPKLDDCSANDFIPEYNAMDSEVLNDDATINNEDGSIGNLLEDKSKTGDKGNEDTKLDNAKFTCKICVRQYKAKSGLMQHIRNYHKFDEAKQISNFNIKCKQCDESFPNEMELRNHIKKHSKSFSLHQQRHTRVRASARQITDAYRACIKVNDFNSKQEEKVIEGLAEVANKIHGDGEIITDSLKEDSKQKTVDNLKTKLDKADFSCTLCSRSYKARRGLLQHIRNYHKMAEAKKSSNINVDCKECGKTFPHGIGWKGHLTEHGGCCCDICGKSFKAYSYMMSHRKRHTGIKAFKCKECDNTFYTKKELLAHTIRHTGILPDMCEICGRGFRDKGVLKAHKRRHTGERPAKCQECGKCFYSIYDLNVHSVTHSTERPFICSTCLATFQTKKALRVHNKLHSVVRKHECQVCGKEFSQTTTLNAHMKKEHTII